METKSKIMSGTKSTAEEKLKRAFLDESFYEQYVKLQHTFSKICEKDEAAFYSREPDLENYDLIKLNLTIPLEQFDELIPEEDNFDDYENNFIKWYDDNKKLLDIDLFDNPGFHGIYSDLWIRANELLIARYLKEKNLYTVERFRELTYRLPICPF
jgi:hypothetical protein